MLRLKALAKWIVRLFLLLLLILGAAIIYLSLRGFPPALIRVVEDQLRRQGVAAKFQSIQLDVLRGVVATDAALADAKAPDQPLVRIDHVQILWNWHRLVHGQNGIDALRIANATVSVPTPADEIGGEVFQAAEAYATVHFEDDGAVRVDQLEGVYAGVQVHLSGRVKFRSATDLSPPKKAPEGSGRSQFVFVTKALREIHQLHGARPPQLSCRFNLNLASPLDSEVALRLFASGVSYRKVNVRQVVLDVAMRDGAVDLNDISLKVERGELSVQGRYDVAGGGFDLRVNSSLDPNLFLPSLPDELTREAHDIKVFDPPKFALRYVLSPETGVLPVLRGRIELGRFEYRTVPFVSVAFDIEQQGPQVTITNALIVMKEGRLLGHGRYHIETSDFTYEVDSTLDPVRLLPLMYRAQKMVVEPSRFVTPPHVVARVRGDYVDPEAFAYDATLQTGRCSYRGVPLKAVSARLKLRRNRLDVRDLVVERDEGTVRGTMLADFEEHRVTFDLENTANPTEMAGLLGPRAVTMMKPYRFGALGKSTGKGVVDWEIQSNSCWQAHLDCDAFSYWKFNTGRATADVSFANNVLTIENFAADFYDGKLRASAVFGLTNDVPYRFQFETERANLHTLLADIRGKEGESSGFMTGDLALAGHGTDLDSIEGKGKLTVEDGVLWEVPLFGIFSHILNDIGPGLGMTKATKATATFKIEDQCVKSDDIKVAAGSTGVDARGKVCFDGKLAIYVIGQPLRSVPGINIITWFLSHVFEYKVVGTIGNYSYFPVNFPKEIMPHGDAPKPKPDAN